MREILNTKYDSMKAIYDSNINVFIYIGVSK